MNETVDWSQKGRRGKYPWRTLAVGNTFDIPVGPDQPTKATIKAACYQMGKKLGRKFLHHQYESGLIQVYRRD